MTEPPAGKRRLDLATLRARNQRYFWVSLVLQALALVAGGLLTWRTGQVGWVVAALAVAPLAAVGFGLMTMVHFRLIQAQKQDR